MREEDFASADGVRIHMREWRPEGAPRAVVNPGRNSERVLEPLSDGNALARGDVLLIETGGGGGRGHPYDRPEALVLRDVSEGYVSTDAARREYGVVIEDGALDSAATEAMRADRPAADAFHRREYVHAFA